MAYTKIHPIKVFLKDALEYIMDKEKTDGQLLVSGHGCTPQTANWEFRLQHEIAKDKVGDYYNSNSSTLAYHLIQSFKPEEVTPETAHEIGKKLADELYRGKYQYVITTHIDKGHIHNHIMINATNLESHRKLNLKKGYPFVVWEKSNEICKEYDLSTIEPSYKREKGKTHYEWQHEKAGTSYKAQLKIAIDEAILSAKNYEELLDLLKQKGYLYIKRGNTISFKRDDQKKATRLSSLGKEYTEEKIAQRIAALLEEENKDFITNVSRAAEGKGFYNNQYELKRLAATIAILQQNDIHSFDIMEMKIAETEVSMEELKETLNQMKERMTQYNVLIDKLELYQRLKPIAENYDKAMMKKTYYNKHKDKLEMYYALEKKLKSAGVNPETLQLAGVLMQQKELLERQKEIQEQYKATKNQLYELQRTNDHVKQILKPNYQENKSGIEKQKKEER